MKRVFADPLIWLFALLLALIFGMTSLGGLFLSRNPDAPARNASNTYSSRSNIVNTITLGPATSEQSERVASSPLMRGICTSMSTTSGRCSRARSTASLPSAASPITDIPGSCSTRSRSEERITLSSSAINTRIALTPAPRSRLRPEGARSP